jgi:tRNA nucleotidyltransferase (CCA-adding enzyme)
MTTYIKLPDTPDMWLAKRLARAAQKEGYRVLLTGGSVLAGLLNIEGNDVDVAITSPVEITKKLPMPGTKVIGIGEQYGTVKFLDTETGAEVEATTTHCRLTRSGDSRRDVTPTFVCDNEIGPATDAKRRDLRVDALFAELDTGQVLDYVGGLKDIKDRVVQFVGDEEGAAIKRCQDDAIRVLRFVRKGARYMPLGFTISPVIFDVVEDPLVRRRLELLSGERVRDEFFGMLKTSNAAWALSMLLELGILEMWFRELYALVGMQQNIWHSHDVWGHTLLALEHMTKLTKDLEPRVAVVFHDIGKGVTQATKVYGNADESKCKLDYGFTFHGHEGESIELLQKQVKGRLKMYGAASDKHPVNMDVVEHLIANHMNALRDTGKVSRILKRLGVSSFGPGMLDYSYLLFEADTMGRNMSLTYPEDLWKVVDRGVRTYNKIKTYLTAENVVSVKELEINGHDVMRMLNIDPSRKVRDVLRRVFELVSEEELLNDREELLVALWWAR